MFYYYTSVLRNKKKSDKFVKKLWKNLIKPRITVKVEMEWFPFLFVSESLEDLGLRSIGGPPLISGWVVLCWAGERAFVERVSGPLLSGWAVLCWAGERAFVERVSGPLLSGWAVLCWMDEQCFVECVSSPLLSAWGAFMYSHRLSGWASEHNSVSWPSFSRHPYAMYRCSRGPERLKGRWEI